MSVVIVLGGGISGLSTAYYLKKLAGEIISKVIVLEKSASFGGWIKSLRFDNNVIHELGPRSIRPAGSVGKNTLQLIEDLKLREEVVPIPRTHPASTKRYVVQNGKLTVLPLSLKPVFKTMPPFKHALIWSGLKDLFIARRSKLDDESVHDFITRRFGKHIADYITDPLCRGIVAGCSRKISVRSLFPNFHEAEQNYGSVIAGLVKLQKKNDPRKFSHDSELCRQASAEKWSSFSFKQGLQLLPETIANKLRTERDVELRSNTGCDRLIFEDNKAKVFCGDDCYEGDHVISCLPSFNLSGILPQEYSSLTSNLSAISFVTVAVINLEYDGNVLPVQAFGYLIPSCEPSKVLGVVFDSCNFSEHNGSDGVDRTRLTCMLGGHWFREYFGDVETANQESLLQIAVDEVKERLDIVQEPSRYNVSIQKDCIPQYTVGHHKRVESIKDEINKLKIPLSVTGSSYDGVSVNDVIFNARESVQSFIDSSRS